MLRLAGVAILVFAGCLSVAFADDARAAFELGDLSGRWVFDEGRSQSSADCNPATAIAVRSDKKLLTVDQTYEKGITTKQYRLDGKAQKSAWKDGALFGRQQTRFAGLVDGRLTLQWTITIEGIEMMGQKQRSSNGPKIIERSESWTMPAPAEVLIQSECGRAAYARPKE